MSRLRSMRGIAVGMRWPIALTALLLALVGYWQWQGGLSAEPPSVVESNEPSPAGAVCLDSGGNRVSCTPRDVSRFDLFSGRASSGVAHSIGPAATVEETLEMGLRQAGASPVHIAVRATADADSVRCEWRGIARTTTQREEAIRFWLGLDEDDDLPNSSLLEALFTVTLETIEPVYLATAKSNFMAIVDGGLSEEYLFLTCHAEYAVSEYLLGAGPISPNKLSVAYDRMGEARSYELYREEHGNGSFGDEPLMKEGEYLATLDAIVADAELSLREIIGGRESVVFLAPMGAHNAIAVEVWQVVDQWDLQTAEDGTVNAVRYGALEGDPEQTQTLANLKSRVTTATMPSPTPEAMPTRIPNVDGLKQYYQDVGAYGDITPDDGQTMTFTPAQEPPPCGRALPGQAYNSGLMRDCMTLLAARDSLRGTARLNWSVDTTITGWDGVGTSGTPSRVTELDLSSERLTGSIPEELGNLREQTKLDLSSNSLTGEVPRKLGLLENLVALYLNGNNLTGPIPTESGDLPNLSRLSIDFAENSSYPVVRKSGESEWSLDSADADLFSIDSAGLLTYKVAPDYENPADDNSDNTYEVCIRPSSSATCSSLEGGLEVTVTVTNTDDAPVNNTPRFIEGHIITRTVPENAEMGTAVGGPVTARDEDNDRLEYWLLGPDAASFDMDRETGQLTTKTMLDYEVKSEYLVWLRVRDDQRGVNGANLTIFVLDMDEPPLQPGAPEVSSAGPTSLTVSWAAPDTQGPEITDYDVQYREADGEFRNAGNDGVGLSATLKDLKPGTGYEVQVRAINADGTSAWSESGRGETEVEPPTPAPTATSTPEHTPTLKPEPTATSITNAPTSTPTVKPEPTPTATTNAPESTPTVKPEPTATPESTPALTPTPRPTVEPVPSEEAVGGDGGFPRWAIVIVIGIVAGVVLIAVVRSRRRFRS